jgi:hypothetical protein
MFKLKTVNVYLIGGVLGVLVGAILYYGQPVTWEGDALVKIGKYSDNVFIEEFADVTALIYSNGFIKKVAERIKRDEIIKMLSPQDDARLFVRKTKDGESLTIRVSGNTAEIVQISLDAILVELLSRHEALLNNYKLDVRKEESRLYLEQEKLLESLPIKSNRDTSCIYSPSVEKILEPEFDFLQIMRVMELNKNMALKSINVHARPTNLMGIVSISERRFFPSLWRPCLLGALAGLFIIAIWIRWGKWNSRLN